MTPYTKTLLLCLCIAALSGVAGYRLAEVRQLSLIKNHTEDTLGAEKYPPLIYDSACHYEESAPEEYFDCMQQYAPPIPPAYLKMIKEMKGVHYEPPATNSGERELW